MMYQGDTITLRCEFREATEGGSPGGYYDPGGPKVAVYDSRRRLLDAQPAEVKRASLGVYEAAYTLPMGQEAIKVAWTGVDGQGHPIRAAVTIEGIQWAE